MNKGRMSSIADKPIIDLLRGRDGAATLVRMKSGVTFKVFNIAWGYDMDDAYAHVTSNISPSLPSLAVDLFHTNDIERLLGAQGQDLPTQSIYAVLNGNHFSDLEQFFGEVQRSLTRDVDWHIGENLNAFNDVLWGGFGLHEYGEPLWLVWLAADKSRRDLGEELFNDIVGIIKGHGHVALELQ
jgi:hypothetical protein